MLNSLKNSVCRGYVRVSTDLQVQDGVSIETQVKKIQSYCELKDWNLVNIYIDEGISGKDRNRPQLKQLFSDILTDEFMLVTDLSRFSRSTLDAITMVKDLETKGAYLVTITDNIDFSTPMGRCMFRMLMSFHELERETISANISTNMQRLSREGKLRTRPPFGWKFVSKDQDLEIVPSQQECIEKIKQMYLSGIKIAQITRTLNSDGSVNCLHANKRTVKPELTPRFYDQTVRRILIDHKLIQPENPTVALESRIVSQHKET